MTADTCGKCQQPMKLSHALAIDNGRFGTLLCCLCTAEIIAGILNRTNIGGGAPE